MSNNNNKQLGEAPWLHVLLSTCLGTGLIPGAPGTYAALLALLIWLALWSVLSPTALLIATLALLIGTTLVGIWTTNVMERYWGEDPRAVVIDEPLGTWMACLAVSFFHGPAWQAVTLATLGFLLFRIIDITKPLGCRWVDQNIHGGWGCMADDLLAGFYAMLLTLAVRASGLLDLL
ncbi:MAG: phosphatidylglycerophosphatase A [Bacteroidaceae bacterium]|nr:phosphatidylglycerophosphatase A [Bacteroidaceae bacterium]